MKLGVCIVAVVASISANTVTNIFSRQRRLGSGLLLTSSRTRNLQNLQNPTLGAPFTNYLLSKQFASVKPFINLKTSENQRLLPSPPPSIIGRNLETNDEPPESGNSFSFDLHPEEKLSRIVNKL